MEQVFVTQLTPLLFLERSADVFPQKTAMVYRGERHTYAQMADHAQRLAGALRASGVQPGDRVAYLMPNLPEMLVAHFGVPLAHAVLVAINIRLSGEEIAYILQHSGAKVLVADSELTSVVARHLASCPDLQEVVVVDDVGTEPAVEATPYPDFLARADGTPFPWRVDDEQRTISINYTSGTTGRPKGVMYTHRGAHLNALAEIVHSRHHPGSVYLWTLPMFHCNGWCTTWGVTAIGGTHVCLRSVEPGTVWKLIDEEGRHPPQRGSHRAHLPGQSSRRPPGGSGSGGDHRRGPSQPHHHRPDGGAGSRDRPRVRPDRDVRAVHGL
ncbi:MAG: hypothetical protein KatS3mg011_1935 [Acidimicrobiia bacterium]|nr:MAG: hypothetical protein KatS3mg011_1935 [Acidimicrobiia bacterium]